jgi:hypothetical protein
MTAIYFPSVVGDFLKLKSLIPRLKNRCNSKTYLEVRGQEHLFEEEMEAMVNGARKGR